MRTHPYFNGGIRVSVEPRPTDDDEQATATTIERMSQLVAADADADPVRQAARQAIERHPDRDARAAVFWWIRDRVKFVPDSELATLAGLGADTEVLIRPVDLLDMPQPAGDCDDHAMLGAAMLRTLGHRVAFKTVAAEPGNPKYSHVYVVAGGKEGSGRPLSLDFSHGPWPGWEVERRGKVQTWPIEESMSRLGFTDTSTPAWQGWVGTGVDAFANIATARWGQPPAGTYISSPTGSVYRAPEGTQPSAWYMPTTGNAGALGGSTLLLVGLGLAALLILRK